MNEIKQSVEYARQAASVFVKPLTTERARSPKQQATFEICASPAEHDN